MGSIELIYHGDSHIWHKHNRESLARITREVKPLEECKDKNNKSFHDDTTSRGSSATSSMGDATWGWGV